jgi:hypothetical protein
LILVCVRGSWFFREADAPLYSVCSKGTAKRGLGENSVSSHLYFLEVHILKLSTKEVGISFYARSKKDGVSLELRKLQIKFFLKARSSKVGVAWRQQKILPSRIIVLF